MNIITGSAIVGEDGKVYSLPKPARHHNVIRMMVEQGHRTPVCGEQGFVLDDGRYVNRKQAAALALESKQIIELRWPPDLYSEDLW
jgi:hypothetical protein